MCKQLNKTSKHLVDDWLVLCCRQHLLHLQQAGVGEANSLCEPLIHQRLKTTPVCRWCVLRVFVGVEGVCVVCVVLGQHGGEGQPQLKTKRNAPLPHATPSHNNPLHPLQPSSALRQTHPSPLAPSFPAQPAPQSIPMILAHQASISVTDVSGDT